MLVMNHGARGHRTKSSVFSFDLVSGPIFSVVPARTAENTHVKYATFAKDTVLPACSTNTGSGSENTMTWCVVDTIPGVRDWLFAQTKPANA